MHKGLAPLIVIAAVAIFGLIALPVVADIEEVSAPTPAPSQTPSPSPSPSSSPEVKAASTALPENGSLNITNGDSSIKVTNNTSVVGNCNSNLKVETKGNAEANVNSECQSTSTNSYKSTSSMQYSISN